MIYELKTKEKKEVLPAAKDLWRQAKNASSFEAKCYLRADHLEELIDEGIVPNWSLYLEPLPEYVDPIPQAILDLKLAQSTQLMQAIADHLRSQATVSSAKSDALMETVARIYESDPEGLQQARSDANELIEKDKAKTKSDLERFKRKYQRDNLSNPVDLSDILKYGPQTAQKILVQRPKPNPRGNA